MTEKLKQLMHEQASAPHFDPVDVAALVDRGNRQVRKRRWATAGGGALAAVAVGGVVTVAQLVGTTAPDPAPATDPAGSSRQVTWSLGSTIYEGDAQIDIGHEVEAYVETSLGYVAADADGAVWSVNQGGTTQVGTVDTRGLRLVSDPEGTFAGWVETVDGQPGFVVHDQASRTTTRYDAATGPGMGSLADEADPAFFYAIDDRTAYWRDRRGAVAMDLVDRRVRVVDAKARNGFDIVAVENGQIAFLGNSGTKIGATPDRAFPLPETYGSQGAFSPGGAGYYSADADEPSVWDLTTREQVELPGMADYFFGTGYSWLDRETLVLIAMRGENDPIELVTCTVPEGTCQTETDFPQSGGTPDFRLPVGEGWD